MVWKEARAARTPQTLRIGGERQPDQECRVGDEAAAAFSHKRAQSRGGNLPHPDKRDPVRVRAALISALALVWSVASEA